jgi:hypothetical protein
MNYICIYIYIYTYIWFGRISEAQRILEHALKKQKVQWLMMKGDSDE